MRGYHLPAGLAGARSGKKASGTERGCQGCGCTGVRPTQPGRACRRTASRAHTARDGRVPIRTSPAVHFPIGHGNRRAEVPSQAAQDRRRPFSLSTLTAAAVPRRPRAPGRPRRAQARRAGNPWQNEKRRHRRRHRDERRERGEGGREEGREKSPPQGCVVSATGRCCRGA